MKKDRNEQTQGKIIRKIKKRRKKKKEERRDERYS